MLDADLSGSDAHGIFRLPGYVRTLKRGHINPQADIKVIERGPATALIDGDNGMGHLVMTRAANTAVEIAREAGVAWVGVRRSNHAGAASTYAAIPLAHGMVGIYGAVAYTVEQRTGEIGVRIALGAQIADVLRLVVRQGMSPVIIGLGLGLAAALALGRLLTAQLYEVSANNPALLAATSVTLAIVALLACLIPARRASLVNPIEALRTE